MDDDLNVIACVTHAIRAGVEVRLENHELVDIVRDEAGITAMTNPIYFR